MKENEIKLRGKERGSILILLMLGLIILFLLYIFSMIGVQKKVQRSGDGTTDIIDPVIQNPQKNVDDVRNQINEQVKNEQKKLDDAAKKIEE